MLSPTRNSSQNCSSPSIARRRNTMPSSASSGVLPGPRSTQPKLTRDDSFASSMSLYSNASHGSFHTSERTHEHFSPVDQYQCLSRPATTLPDRKLHGHLMPSESKSSTWNAQRSDTSTCRSLFLSPSAERDVSRALYTLEAGSASRRRVSFTGPSTGHLRDIQEHHIRSFYNADAVSSA